MTIVLNVTDNPLRAFWSVKYKNNGEMEIKKGKCVDTICISSVL